MYIHTHTRANLNNITQLGKNFFPLHRKAAIKTLISGKQKRLHCLYILKISSTWEAEKKIKGFSRSGSFQTRTTARSHYPASSERRGHTRFPHRAGSRAQAETGALSHTVIHSDREGGLPNWGLNPSPTVDYNEDYRWGNNA